MTQTVDNLLSKNQETFGEQDARKRRARMPKFERQIVCSSILTDHT
jgi:hypothetical protein